MIVWSLKVAKKWWKYLPGFALYVTSAKDLIYLAPIISISDSALRMLTKDEKGKGFDNISL